MHSHRSGGMAEWFGVLAPASHAGRYGTGWVRVTTLGDAVLPAAGI